MSVMPTDTLRMLTNAAYKGCSTAHFRPSSNFSERTYVASGRSWPPVVHPTTWEAVQARLNHSHWLRSPEGLAVQLRERWATSMQRRTSLNAGNRALKTFQKYFEHGVNDAICQAYAAEIDREWSAILRELSRPFDLQEDRSTVVLNGSLRVGYKAAFPRANRLGRLHWRFIFAP